MLQVPAVDVFDNFFDLGGHSISATRLIFQVRQTFKIDLPLTAVRPGRVHARSAGIAASG